MTDSARPRASLVPRGVIAAVIRVLEGGATKHSVNGWMNEPNARTLNYDAAMRHIDDWWMGKDVDDESGESPLAHAICRLMFLWWFDDQVELPGDEAIEVSFGHVVEAVRRAADNPPPAAPRPQQSITEWACGAHGDRRAPDWTPAANDVAPVLCPKCGSPEIRVRVGGKEIT